MHVYLYIHIHIHTYMCMLPFSGEDTDSELYQSSCADPQEVLKRPTNDLQAYLSWICTITIELQGLTSISCTLALVRQSAHSEGLHFWRTKTFLPPLTVWGPAFTGITLPTIWYLWQAGKVNCYFQVCFLSPRKEKPPDTDLLSTTYLYFESCELWALGYTLGLEPPALHCTRVHISSPPHVVHSKISTCTVCKDLFLRLSHEHNPILILLGLWRNLKSYVNGKIPPNPSGWLKPFLSFLEDGQFSSVHFSCSVVSDSLQPHGLQYGQSVIDLFLSMLGLWCSAQGLRCAWAFSSCSEWVLLSSCSALFWREQRL